MCWPAHGAFETVKHWFAQRGSTGWSTCPFTQSAFVRIISNPAFSRDALESADAVNLLERNLAHPTHQFWPADLRVADALADPLPKITGHKQVTDAYLIALALRHKGKLATLDRGIAQLAPTGVVEVIA
jgi:toxin-antitoxin system PIN domain toxin